MDSKTRVWAGAMSSSPNSMIRTQRIARVVIRKGEAFFCGVSDDGEDCVEQVGSDWAGRRGVASSGCC